MSGIVGSAGSKSGVIGTTELDVENGTWTPSPNASSLSSFSAEYSRVGRLVQIRAYCNFGASSTSFNSMSGLPFSVASGEHTFWTAGAEFIAMPGGSFNNNNSTMWCYAAGGSKNVTFGAWGWSLGWGGSLGVTSSSIMMFSGVYSTND